MLFQSVWKLISATTALSTGFLLLLKLGRTVDRLDSGKCNIVPDMLYARQSSPQRYPWKFSSLQCENM